MNAIGFKSPLTINALNTQQGDAPLRPRRLAPDLWNVCMRIICPTCSSHYEVESDKIDPKGQLVRCAQCRGVWLVRAPEEEVAAAPLEAVEPTPEQPPETSRLAPRPAAPIPAPMSPAVPPAAPVVAPARVVPIDFQSASLRLRRRRDAAETPPARASSLGAITIGAVVLTALMAVYGFRGAITRHLPAAGTAYAAVGLPVDTDGLALRDVHSALVAEGSETVLTLEGKIANLRNGATTIPALNVVVRGDTNVPLYTWTATAPKSKLEPGETVVFRSRLAEPPAAGRNVQVSFVDPKDDGVQVTVP